MNTQGSKIIDEVSRSAIVYVILKDGEVKGNITAITKSGVTRCVFKLHYGTGNIRLAEKSNAKNTSQFYECIESMKDDITDHFKDIGYTIPEKASTSKWWVDYIEANGYQVYRLS